MALDEESINKVRLMLASSAWNDVVVPAIAKRARDAIRALCLYPTERSGDFRNLTDDQIRSRISEDEWLLVAFDTEVKMFDANRMGEELARQMNGANPQDLAANP